MAIQVKSISQLDPTTAVADGSLFEVSIPAGGGKYSSKRLTY